MNFSYDALELIHNVCSEWSQEETLQFVMINLALFESIMMI